MNFGSEKGQVTVFLSIILIVVIVLSGVLIDGAKIAAGENNAKRSVTAAIRSALANYDSKLKNEYGIYSLSVNAPDNLKSFIIDYVNKNLNTKASQDNERGGLDLYGFRVENISVYPMFNLSENTVTKNMILEFMKYRAPKQIAEGLIDRLSQAKDASKMSEAFKQKTVIDKLAGKIASIQQKLKKLVSGTIGDGKDAKKFINGFNLGGIWDSLSAKYAGYVDQYRSLVTQKANLDNVIALFSGQGSEDSEKELENLKKQANDLANSIAKVSSDMDKTIFELREEQTNAYIYPNSQAIQYIQDIFRLSTEVKAAVQKLKDFLGQAFAGKNSSGSGRFTELITQDIGKIEDAILSGQESELLIGQMKSNKELLDKAAYKIVEIASAGKKGNLSGSEILNSFKGLIYGYGSVSYDYKKVDKGVTGEDPRETQKKDAKDKLKNSNNADIDMKSKGIDINQLPSHKKVQSSDFSNKDGKVNSDSTGTSENTASKEASYSGNIENIGEEVDFEDDDSDEGFSYNAFDFIGTLGDILGDGFSKLRDNLYINEYIMGTFKNVVPALKENGKEEKDLNLRGLEKSKLMTFYSYETEYILQGYESQEKNRLITKGEILLLRFAMDTLHVYMDPEKRRLAEGIAAAVSGWWTGGLGIPIISNLIMCAWGMGEALLDIEHLLKGEAIPFYKQKGDWELSIGLGKSTGQKTDKKLKFTYYDYLRLFLLFKSTDDKINRTEDLIELNCNGENNGFKMANHNTMLRVEATVSMKYLFVTRLFTHDASNTNDGRRKFNFVLYEGY